MKGKYTKRRGVATKTMVMVLALVLVIGISVGGTLAWLTAKTDDVVNTFTVGNINIELDEVIVVNGVVDAEGDRTTEGNSYKMVPGVTYTKDPEVTVLANSEASWLFVKVTKTENFDTYMSFTIADGWTELTEGSGIYYRKAAATGDSDAEPISVIKNDQITINSTVTKAQMDALQETGATQPSVSFTAYAIQQEGFDTAATAWAEVSK